VEGDDPLGWAQQVGDDETHARIKLAGMPFDFGDHPARLAHARLHVEHDAAGRSAVMHKVDPLAGQVGKSRKVLVCSKPSRLKAANLARRSYTAHDGFAADNPAHRRIVPKRSASLTSSYPARRPNTDCRSKPTSVRRRASRRHHAQAKSVVEFAVGQQLGIRGDNGAAKLQRQAAVEIEPNSIRYLIHPSGSPSLPRSIHDKLLIAISESRKPRRTSAR
jgi:hypothetical protein